MSESEIEWKLNFPVPLPFDFRFSQRIGHQGTALWLILGHQLPQSLITTNPVKITADTMADAAHELKSENNLPVPAPGSGSGSSSGNGSTSSGGGGGEKSEPKPPVPPVEGDDEEEDLENDVLEDVEDVEVNSPEREAAIALEATFDTAVSWMNHSQTKVTCNDLAWSLTTTGKHKRK